MDALAETMFGIGTSEWEHEKIVRSRLNTLQHFQAPLTNRFIEEDNFVYIGLGLIFERSDADFGRTYWLGSDTKKLRVNHDLKPVWQGINARFREREAHNHRARPSEIATQEEAKESDIWACEHAGRLIGEFARKPIPEIRERYMRCGAVPR